MENGQVVNYVKLQYNENLECLTYNSIEFWELYSIQKYYKILEKIDPIFSITNKLYFSFLKKYPK